MERDEALALIGILTGQGRVAFAQRFLQEKMRPYGITPNDVVHCLGNPFALEHVEAAKGRSCWCVTGLGLAGHALSVCVVIESDVLRVVLR